MDVSVDGTSPASEWAFPFDSNGLRMGVEAERPESEQVPSEKAPGAKIAAWQAQVRAIVEQR